MLYLLKVYVLVVFFVSLPVAALYLAGGAALMLNGSFRKIKAAYRTRLTSSEGPALPLQI